MIRLLALLLVLANALYFAWSRDDLRIFGLGPQVQSEPQRLSQQINPRTVHVLTPQEASEAQAQARAELAARDCLLAGPFSEARKNSLDAQLAAALPAGTWQWELRPFGALWLVYAGTFADQNALLKKRTTFAALGVPSEVLTEAPLAPGLSLGSYDSQAQALVGLAHFRSRGVRTARVLQQRAEGSAYQLKVPAPDAAVKARLNDFTAALGAQSLHACH